MEKLNYLNLGCGPKFHKAWFNVDIVPYDSSIIQCDLTKGISFPNNTFEVVYSSQVIEHIPPNSAAFFIKECFRVTKPGGIIRVVTPDLERIAKDYLFYLDKCLSAPDEITVANYDWVLLEMYDQTIRNSIGGEMMKVLRKKYLPNENFILQRTGLSGESIRKGFLGLNKISHSTQSQNINGVNGIVSRIIKKISRGYLKTVLSRKQNELLETGKFRRSGEIHYCMYDRFSLKRLLNESGFKDVSLKTAFESDVPDWASFELDAKDGIAFDPISLFMEAKK